jgi:hypothetical protein
MYCPACGAPNDDNAYRCTRCQAMVQPVAAEAKVAPLVVPSRDPTDDPAMRFLLPVGRSGWAIAAGYAGLLGLLIFPAPLALVLGIVAAYHLKKHPKKLGWGRTIFGLLVGALGTAGMLIVYLLTH